MQADLFTGPLLNQKLSGKEYLNSKETQNSSRQGIFRGNSESENFIEIISRLSKKVCRNSMENKEEIDAFRELLGDDLSESFLSELLPYIDSLNHPIDNEKQNGELDTLLLAFQKMVGLDSNCGDSSVVIEESVDLKEAFLKGNENQGQSHDEENIFTARQNNSISSILEMPDAIDENVNNRESIDFELGEYKEEEDTDQGDAFKSNFSKSQKNHLYFNEVIDGHRNRVEEIKRNEIKQNILQESGLSNKGRDNSSILSKLSDGSISEAIEIDDQKKNAGFNKTGDNSEIHVAKEESNQEKLKSLSNEIKSSLNTSHQDNNGGDSTIKFNSDKVSSTTVETKSFSRPLQLNQTEIIQQIVEKAKLSGTKDNNEITIKLKPEILGNIRLNISTENHHVTIKVMADSSTVKDILENNLHHLRNGFAHQGLEIGSFDVMVGDQPQNFFKGQGFSGFQRGRRQTADTKKFVLNEVEESEELSFSSPHRSVPEKDRIDYYV